jgi:Mlc titration factor MtfA (ptsG expression regulator)
MWSPRKQRRPPDFSQEAWAGAIGNLPLLDGMHAEHLDQLTSHAARFLRKKRFETAQSAEADPEILLEIALQAALPILELGLDWYRGWHAVILYPDQFVPAREVMDEDGVVWIDNEPKSGEAWEQGPVILSLADVEAGRVRDGYNVVIHEMAHKLDLLDGAANGHPPLHRGMSDAAWARDLGSAYDDHCQAVDEQATAEDLSHWDEAEQSITDPQGPPPLVIDPYASESPAEFFAVCSEAFFETPELLLQTYPQVYAQLRAFYRQDPAGRLAAADQATR